jgi:hypothetical protein
MAGPPPGLRLGLRLKDIKDESENENSNENENNTIGLLRVNFLTERGPGAHGVVKVEGLKRPGENLQRVRKSVVNNGSPLGDIQLKDIKREIMVYSELKKKNDSEQPTKNFCLSKNETCGSLCERSIKTSSKRGS